MIAYFLVSSNILTDEPNAVEFHKKVSEYDQEMPKLHTAN